MASRALLRRRKVGQRIGQHAAVTTETGGEEAFVSCVREALLVEIATRRSGEPRCACREQERQDRRNTRPQSAAHRTPPGTTRGTPGSPPSVHSSRRLTLAWLQFVLGAMSP